MGLRSLHLAVNKFGCQRQTHLQLLAYPLLYAAVHLVSICQHSSCRAVSGHDPALQALAHCMRG